MYLLLDAGTTYSKIMDNQDGSVKLIPTKDLPSGFISDIATGHNIFKRTKKPVNELIALAKGGLRLVEEDDFIILDIGARDIKYVKIKDKEYSMSDWNVSCGAFAGFTIEMVGNYFNLDYNSIEPSKEEIPVTCGVLGMSHLFDLLGKGHPVSEAASLFVKGIVMNIFRFAGRPEKIYLSGGLCNNNLVIKSFSCEVIPLGRYVLLEGLKTYI